MARPPIVERPFSKSGIKPSLPPSISSRRPSAANTSIKITNTFIIFPQYPAFRPLRQHGRFLLRRLQISGIICMLRGFADGIIRSILFCINCQPLKPPSFKASKHQLHQNSAERQHQRPAGARHDLREGEKLHPLCAAEHRHVAGTAHIGGAHPGRNR